MEGLQPPPPPPPHLIDGISYYSRLCLPLNLLYSALDKVQEHSHSGLHIEQQIFNPYYYIPFLQTWLSIFVYNCMDCQLHK